MKRLDREFILKTVKGSEQSAVNVKAAEDAVKYARAFYSDDISIYESAFIILLNRSNNTIGWAKIGQGGLSATIVDVRIVCKYAIDSLASGVIFVHNHPSGCILPSVQDESTTKRLKDALNILDVKLLDSIIITESSYYSFCEMGKI